MKIPKDFKRVNRGKCSKDDYVKHQKFGVYKGILTGYTIKKCSESGYSVYRRRKTK